jgi:hypothetical protein
MSVKTIIWNQIRKSGVVVGLLSVVLAIPALAAASSITFDFNTVVLTAGVGQDGGLGAHNAAVQTYMTNKLGAAGTVTVTGAQADTTYTGDGHVVGPTTCVPWWSCSTTSLTLGNTEGDSPTTPGATDTFIDTLGSNNSPSDILMNFNLAGGAKIGSVSFDYQIFPDGSGNQPPDFTFKADGTTYLFATGVVPPIDGFSNSPNSCNGYVWNCHSEQSPQLGPETFTQSFGGGGVSSLDFIDWPAMVAIDNLTITTTTTTQSVVPEPGTMLLLGTGLFGSYLRKRRQAAK